jgi:hypothetical protein
VRLHCIRQVRLGLIAQAGRGHCAIQEVVEQLGDLHLQPDVIVGERFRQSLALDRALGEGMRGVSDQPPVDGRGRRAQRDKGR